MWWKLTIINNLVGDGIKILLKNTQRGVSTDMGAWLQIPSAHIKDRYRDGGLLIQCWGWGQKRQTDTWSVLASGLAILWTPGSVGNRSQRVSWGEVKEDTWPPLHCHWLLCLICIFTCVHSCGHLHTPHTHTHKLPDYCYKGRKQRRMEELREGGRARSINTITMDEVYHTYSKW